MEERDYLEIERSMDGGTHREMDRLRVGGMD
jgi:hypothetical protein